MRISVIVPALNETRDLLAALSRLEHRTDIDEVVVVDASRDIDVAALYAATDSPLPSLPERGFVLLGTPFAGRARQMNLGAQIAGGDLLLFLHVDTRLPEGDLGSLLRPALPKPGWGRFDVSFDHRAWWATVIAAAMNLRSALTGIATGDQCLFASRKQWRACGGFEEIPLMEDIAFSRAMRKTGRPYLVRTPVITSARRWLRHGVARTVLLMWKLRLLYWLGVAPARLARMYRDAR